jgi:hypothetical protein
VNGDGYGDVIVGAHYYDVDETDEGAAFVYYGSAAGLSSTAAVTLESNHGYSWMGFSVASAGDVNGDSYGDVIVGVPLYENSSTTNEGAAFIYYGSAAGLSNTMAITLESDQTYATFGNSVASAGDVNSDGYGDVIVGADRYENGETDEGAAFVYHGSALAETIINTLPKTGDFAAAGSLAQGGTFVAADINLAEFTINIGMTVENTARAIVLGTTETGVPTGPVLWESADVTTPYVGDWTFKPNLSLTVGSRYFIGLDYGAYTSAPGGVILFGLRDDNPIPDGQGWRYFETIGWDPFSENVDIAARIVMNHEESLKISELTLDSSEVWSASNFPVSFTQPVVIVGPPSYRDAAPGVVRLRNVTTSSSRSGTTWMASTPKRRLPTWRPRWAIKPCWMAA